MATFVLKTLAWVLKAQAGEESLVSVLTVPDNGVQGRGNVGTQAHPRDGESHSSQELGLRMFCSSLTPRIALSTAMHRCTAMDHELVNQETWTNKQKNAWLSYTALLFHFLPTTSITAGSWILCLTAGTRDRAPLELTCRMSSICITEEGNLDCANSSKSPSFTFSKTRSRKPSREIWRMVSSCP